MSAIVSRFTPSNASVDLLERLFVGRHVVLDDIADRIGRAANSAERNHTLLVGPRGAGKTHLITLAESRAREAMNEGLHIQTSWPLEDPYGIASYRDFLREVVDGLLPEANGSEAGNVDALEAVITQRADDLGPIILFIENFDQVLDLIGNNGQQRLRHQLQSDKSILLVATTTSLSHAMNQQDAPFYGFFTTTHLEPFDIDTAAEMLCNIAIEDDKVDVAEFLRTDTGRARLRTIAHLAGGQPRIWATLAASLTIDGLDELVNLLLTRFDDLTPYYQEQLNRLSPHQRRVVLALARADHAVSVGELAELVEVDQRSVAKTVKELADKNWVQPVETAFAHLLDGRKTYYELSEPLARLAFQIKAARNTPIETVVEFLKHWFEPGDFDDIADGRLLAYLQSAIDGFDSDPVLRVVRSLEGLPPSTSPVATTAMMANAALVALASGDAGPLMQLPTALRRSIEARESSPPTEWWIDATRADLLSLAADDRSAMSHESLSALCTELEALVDETTHARLRAFVLVSLVVVQIELRRLDEATATNDALAAQAEEITEPARSTFEEFVRVAGQGIEAWSRVVVLDEDIAARDMEIAALEEEIERLSSSSG